LGEADSISEHEQKMAGNLPFLARAAAA